MTAIITPVALTPATLPLPDPSDRATFSARKLEQLRWASAEYSTGSYALGLAAFANATAAQEHALTATAQAAAAASSAALSAGYAGATAWVSGTSYTTASRVWSLANGLIYRRIIAGSGVTDPSLDATNWAAVSLAAPVQLISAAVHQALPGGAYAFTNATTQGAGTNQYTNTNQFNLYTLGACTVTQDAVMGPDGTVTAEKLVESTANAAHYILRNVTTAANVARTDTFCFKAAGRTSLTIAVDKDGLGVDSYQAAFSLSTVAVSGVANAGTASGAAATIAHLGNGWYECSISGTPATSAGTTVRIVIYLNGLFGYLGDGTSGIYAAQDQGEAGSKSSFITSGATAGTRVAGVVAPQRLILPASPSANDWVRIVPRNGVTTNIVDPNSSTIEGQAGPINLDDGSATLQYVNSTWSFVK